MTELSAATIATPAGAFSLLAGDCGIYAAGFTRDIDRLVMRLDRPRRTRSYRTYADLGELTDTVGRYFSGDLAACDDLPVVMRGTDFQKAAWQVMRQVPAGTTITYRDLADRLGRPHASRAVGATCAANAIGLIVPCHRVFRRSGSAGGYAWGVGVKLWLRAHEFEHRLRGFRAPCARVKCDS